MNTDTLETLRDGIQELMDGYQERIEHLIAKSEERMKELRKQTDPDSAISIAHQVKGIERDIQIENSGCLALQRVMRLLWVTKACSSGGERRLKDQGDLEAFREKLNTALHKL